MGKRYKRKSPRSSPAFVPNLIGMSPKIWLLHSWLNDNIDNYPWDNSNEVSYLPLIKSSLRSPLGVYHSVDEFPDSLDIHHEPRHNNVSLRFSSHHYPSKFPFGAIMSSSQTFVRDTNSFEFSLEQEYIKFAKQDPKHKFWDTMCNVKTDLYVPAIVSLVKSRLTLVQDTKTIRYEQHTIADTKSKNSGDAQFDETILLGNIHESDKVLISILGGYGNVARCVIATSSDSYDTHQAITKLRGEIVALGSQFSSAIEEHKATFNIIVQDGSGGLSLREFEIAPLAQIDEFVQVNYNDDFAPISHQIVDSINKLDKGITLLHGVPGSGKTNFIRYLAHKIKDKNLVYIPPEMTSVLAQPSFINFVMDNQGSVFIVEDAESILRTREAGDNSAVANILNMSDGIIGDAVKCQFLCTFNCDYSEVDNALKRKGRLNCTYEFKALTVNKAQALANVLYPEHYPTITRDMTLAELYNLYTDNGNATLTKDTKRIGF